MNFNEQLQEKIDELGCRVCLGLDPRFEGTAAIPSFLVEEHGGDLNATILEFNKRILEKVGDLVPVVKPQAAYYEAADAMGALKETIALARKLDILVILDGKRNDIGSTSQAYAKAAYEVMGAGSVTVNPYLGSDCVEPFLKFPGRGIFVLVKTSNPSSAEFQDLFSVTPASVKSHVNDDFSIRAGYLDGDAILERNYIKVARQVVAWNGKHREDGERFGPVGAVVGATFPAQLRHLRRVMMDTMFLIPGFGFQGGNPDDVRHGFQDDGTGAVVNSSRALLYAYQLSKENSCPEGRFEEATLKELESMRDELNRAIGP